MYVCVCVCVCGGGGGRKTDIVNINWQNQLIIHKKNFYHN
jgi:hypothetical protein